LSAFPPFAIEVGKMRYRGLASVVAVACLVPFGFGEESVYKKGLRSTVWIVQPVGGNRMRTGSGSLIDAQQKLILTNYHVVGDDDKAFILFPIIDKAGKLTPERDTYLRLLQSNGAIEGKVIGRDMRRDLALIQLQVKSLPVGTPAVRIAKDSPGPSDKVHSIGSPGISAGLFNYTDGSVKTVAQKSWRAQRMPNDPMPLELSAKVIETSSATNKGDSGGPLFNDKCELVGVTQGMSVGAEGERSVSYFIDVSEVKFMLDTLVKAKKIRPVKAAVVASADTPTTDKPMTTSNTQPMTDSAKQEELASSKLILAQELEKGGKLDRALERYRDIVKQYPKTQAAAEAQKLLDKHKKP
jgi:S1-C subfamily serine protease